MTGMDEQPLPAGDLHQPDGRSCGAACVVVDAMLANPAYAARVTGRPDGFADEVRAAHRRLTGLRGADGRTQLPWPRALGTPPWAVARRLGGRHRVVPARWGRAQRGRAFDRVRAAVAAGHRVPLYVGDGWLPRHVVLALSGDGPGDSDLVVYDPAIGRTRLLRRDALVTGPLGVGSWGVPWFVVVPDAY